MKTFFPKSSRIFKKETNVIRIYGSNIKLWKISSSEILSILENENICFSNLYFPDLFSNLNYRSITEISIQKLRNNSFKLLYELFNNGCFEDSEQFHIKNDDINYFKNNINYKYISINKFSFYIQEGE